jgi:hypothetical protein
MGMSLSGFGTARTGTRTPMTRSPTVTTNRVWFAPWVLTRFVALLAAVLAQWSVIAGLVLFGTAAGLALSSSP